MKTPLAFGEGSDREWYIHDADENWIAEAVPNEPGEAEEAARRIVACVNACEGLDTELLEKIVSLGGTLPRRLEAMTNWERSEADKQRDELLAALVGVLPFLTGNHWPGAEADAAIDRAIAIARKVGAGKTAHEGHNFAVNRTLRRRKAKDMEATPMAQGPVDREVVRHALNGKYGDVLAPFVALMEAELHANAAKGDRPGWLAMSPATALLEIYWHTAKLSAAVKNGDMALITEHSADVANMAMMLLDVCGGLMSLDDPGDYPPEVWKETPND